MNEDGTEKQWKDLLIDLMQLEETAEANGVAPTTRQIVTCIARHFPDRLDDPNQDLHAEALWRLTDLLKKSLGMQLSS